MDFFSTVEARRSIRKFKPKQVPESVIQKAIDAALIAPNSSNTQPWEIYWVRRADKKVKLVEACMNQRTARTASDLVVFSVRMDSWPKNVKWNELKSIEANAHPGIITYYKRIMPFVYTQGFLNIFGYLKRILFFFIGLFRPIVRKPTNRAELQEVFVKSTALACENFMLAITAQGFGTCPMEGFDEVRVKNILGLGRQSVIVMVISVGEMDPTEDLGDRRRLPKNSVVFEV